MKIGTAPEPKVGLILMQFGVHAVSGVPEALIHAWIRMPIHFVICLIAIASIPQM